MELSLSFAGNTLPKFVLFKIFKGVGTWRRYKRFSFSYSLSKDNSLACFELYNGALSDSFAETFFFFLIITWSWNISFLRFPFFISWFFMLEGDNRSASAKILDLCNLKLIISNMFTSALTSF